MVSRQTFVVTGPILAALPAAYLIGLVTEQFILSFFALLGIDVGTPSLVNDHLSSRERDEDGV